MNTGQFAKQLLLNQTCMTCNYHNFYYDGGIEVNRIYMCDNPVRTKGIPGLTESFAELDERGTYEEWVS